jgi:MFS family permease
LTPDTGVIEIEPVRLNVALFLGVSLAAGFGGTAMSLAAGVWVMALTGSSGLAALAGLCVFGPTLVGPVLGTIVDRLPARGLLIGTQLGLAALLTTLLTVGSRQELWLLFGVMLAYGVSHVLVDAAEARLLTQALPAAALGATNGARMSAQEATKLLAPLAGAGLFAWAGGGAVAVAAAGALVVSAVFYALVRTDAVRVETTRRRLPAREGLGFLWREPRVRTPVLMAAVAMAASGLGSAAIYAVVVAGLHRPPAFAGVLSSVQGAGAVVGGLVTGRLLARWGETRVAGTGVAVYALGPALQATGWLPAVLAGAAAVGIGLPWTVVAGLTAVQRHTPAPMLGRVAASANTLVFGPVALGIPLGAAIVTATGYRVPLLVSPLLALSGLCAVAGTQSQRLPRAVGVPAAVHRQRRPVDEAAAGGVGQERHGLGDVVG